MAKKPATPGGSGPPFPLLLGVGDAADAPGEGQGHEESRKDPIMNHRDRNRRRFEVEGLEFRLALSSVTGIDDHRHAGGSKPAEVRALKHGADDPANHNANDTSGVDNHNHKQKGKTPKAPTVKIVAPAASHGQEHPAGHK